jgi:hypothetical protein
VLVCGRLEEDGDDSMKVGGLDGGGPSGMEDIGGP